MRNDEARDDEEHGDRITAEPLYVGQYRIREARLARIGQKHERGGGATNEIEPDGKVSLRAVGSWRAHAMVSRTISAPGRRGPWRHATCLAAFVFGVLTRGKLCHFRGFWHALS